MQGLYLICDARINRPVSAIIEQPNDVMALFGFIDFCKKEKEKGLDPICFRLKKIGDFDDEKGQVVETYSKYLVRGDKCEELYAELLKKAVDDDLGV